MLCCGVPWRAPIAHGPSRQLAPPEVMHRHLALVVALSCVVANSAVADEQAELDFFEKRIRPVLVAQCYECHSAKADADRNLKGALRVDTRDALLEGGDSGPAIVPGKPDDSLLLSALHYDGFEMPPKGKLPEKVLADFRQWIEQGAVDPRKDDPEAIVQTKKAEIDYESAREFWAFQRPQRHERPEVENPATTSFGPASASTCRENASSKE